MSSAEDYQLQNVYKYSRKTYKKNRRCPQEERDGEYSREGIDIDSPSPRSEVRSDGCGLDIGVGCSCDVETDGDIACILHKKCPVISLAQQQLQRLLDGTDRLLCDNTKCCSTGCGLDIGKGCSCDVETDGDIACILHKKCPVISLAQQQLQRLLDGTERLLCDNTKCCRSVYDFFCLCKELLLSQDRCMCALMILIVVSFFSGLMLGAASCGSYLGRFNSPIFSCIDNYFVPDHYASIKDSFRSIT